MRKFFVDYIKQDSIGTIANSFLVNADLYGICSERHERYGIFKICIMALSYYIVSDSEGIRNHLVFLFDETIVLQ
uniref:Uncharacterized protein n=1 Tax=Ascaris lumbricoides TaxID=6252 RepID=A0A0M3HM58_ASCLU